MENRESLNKLILLTTRRESIPHQPINWNLFCVPSRTLSRDAPDPGQMEENSLEKLLKRREVGEPSYGGEYCYLQMEGCSLSFGRSITEDVQLCSCMSNWN